MIIYHRNRWRCHGFNCAVTLVVLAVLPVVVFATEPPRLLDVVVEPAILTLGTGERQVTVSVMVVDGDADLDPQSVKLKKVKIGKKNPTISVFADDGQNADAVAGDGRFTTQVFLDTSMPRQRVFRIRAKDQLGNKAVSVSLTVSVGPPLGLSSLPLRDTLNLRLERVFAGLTFTDPVALLQASGDADRWYLVERTGVIQTFFNHPDVSEFTTVLDLRSIVEPLSELDLELGMLALAFHPDFLENGKAYVYYTAETDNGIESRLSRFVRSDEDITFDPDSEEVLIRVEQPRTRHNGGQIAFGSDGLLYFGLGDGGDRFQSQTINSFLGKMLRIDVDGGFPYVIPPNNPFLGENGPSEVYATGLRNPWRWSFDTQTGVLWLGDVGNRRWEEIDIVVPGANYGWPILEGEECAGFLPCDTFTLVNPLFTYDHDDGCSVIGGYVYRGIGIPELDGVYLFSDFCSGAIMGLSTDPAGTLVKNVFVQGGHDPVTGEFGLLVRSLSVDQEGEIYVIENGGSIFRLVPASH
ncbi:MAG: hypothetical protein CMH81_03860 [Nitrospiraceae bacterium]|nr:hypothetical protein [Nitrospiraceae bacterium]